MLIVFPVALLSLVPVTDIVFLATRDPFWARVSFYLLIGGLVSAAIAAVFGLVDFLGIHQARSHRAGWAHVFTNVGVMTLGLVNLLLRTSTSSLTVPEDGLLLSLLTAALLAVGGWYGGELAYRHRIGVMPDPTK